MKKLITLLLIAFSLNSWAQNYQTVVGAKSADGKIDLRIGTNKIALSDSLKTRQLFSEKGSPSGYAGLDGSGKVPLSQISDALIGSVNYKGTYDASTNTPAIPAAASGNKGYYYVVNVAGAFSAVTYKIGDWIISNGVSWAKVDNNNAVFSVAGKMGAVTLVESDIAGLVSDLAGKEPAFTKNSGFNLNASTASNPSTLSLRDGSGNTSFKAINLDTDGGLAITSTTQTTGEVYANWLNTSGSLKWGIENSVGGNFGTGTLPYSTFFGSYTNTAVHEVSNGIVRATLTGAGNKSFTGNLSALNLSGTNNGDQTITLTGDITGSGNGSFVTAIGAGKVTNSRLLNSTISGKALGTNLSTLTFASYLSGTSYNGTSDVTIQVNASQLGAVSSIVASNALGNITLGGGILAGGSQVFTATNQLTAATYGRLSNSNGSLLYGVYNDSGTGFGATNIAGMTANAAGIGTTGNTPYQVFTNGIVRQTIAANGATSFAQALSAFNLSGTNTGDQATVSGNAGSATVLQNARTIQGVSFNGSSNINIINGTGLVRVSGTTLSYDTNSYLTGTENTSTSHSSYEASPIIPFTTWTTFYTITGGVGNYIVSIGLDGQQIADWSAHGMIYSGGSDAAFFLQHNGSLVQIRISGLNIQVYQNGAAGSGIALHASVLRIGGLNP